MRHYFLFFILTLWNMSFSLPTWADVTDAVPMEVGFDGMRFTAASTYNIVARVLISTDVLGGTLTAMFLRNELPSPAEEGTTKDIVPGSVRLWHVYPDTGALNTSTAQYIDSFNYYGPPSQYWELFTNYLVQDGSAFYVTIDITAAPREGATCAFFFRTQEIEFDNGTNYFPATEDMPVNPPVIYLTSYTEPTDLQVSYNKIGPATLSTGQFFSALKFTLRNVNAGQTGPVYLQGLSITVRDAAGAVIPPDTAFASLGLRDNVTKTLLSFTTSLPSSASPAFLPFTISPDSNSVFATSIRELELYGTVTSNTATAVTQFRVGWQAPYDLNALYLYTMKTVTVTAAAGYAFPMQTDLFSVGQTATELYVYHTPTLANNTVVLKGATNVNPLDFTFINPGNSLTSRVDITHLTLAVTNSQGNTISPAAVFSRAAIANGVLYGETTSMSTSSNLITIPLSNNYISVSAYKPVTVSVQVDILPNASAVDFKLALNSPIAVTAQDANRQTPVMTSAAYLSDPFPMASYVIRVASSFTVTGQSLSPTTAYPNQSVAWLAITLTHPGPADMSELQVRGITLTACNRDQEPVALADYCSRIYLQNDQGAVLSQATPVAGRSTVFLSLSNLQIAPFAQVTIRLEAQMQASLPQGTLCLGLWNNSSIDVYQPADPSRPVFVAGTWPILSQAVALGGGEGQLRLSNYPNPFAAGRNLTHIAYYLEQTCNVTATLYTLNGDEVNSLCQRDFQTAGEHILAWNGRTAIGAVVVNGVYLLRLEAVPVSSGKTIVQIRKIAVVK